MAAKENGSLDDHIWPKVDFYLISSLQEVSKDTRYVFVDSLLENAPPKNCKMMHIGFLFDKSNFKISCVLPFLISAKLHDHCYSWKLSCPCAKLLHYSLF